MIARTHAWTLFPAALLLGGTSLAQTTERVSVDSTGSEADNWSYFSTCAFDGRHVAFVSLATDLVAGDTNGAADVFVHDLFSGTTERVSIDSAGVEANAPSYEPVISGDGRFVAFRSDATNLVANDTNGCADVFLRDRQLGTTVRLSMGLGGVQANGESGTSSISPDGHFVTFHSAASNLVAGDTNGFTDVFLIDRQLGTTERVSVATGGVQANSISYDSSVSADGRFVAFSSVATNLVAGDTNQRSDIFVRDRQLGTTQRVSVASGGAQADDQSSMPVISADGRCVAFDSFASNLVPGDTNGTSDCFVHELQNGATRRVSLGAGGAQADDASAYCSISADGRFVGFLSLATNLVAGDTNALEDVFVHDRQLGVTERMNVSSNGQQGNLQSGRCSLSGDGRFAAFDSRSTNLVPGDNNGSEDVFVHDRGVAPLRYCSPGLAGVIACPCGNPPGGPDRGCDNSAATGGAFLDASGTASLAADSLRFTSGAEKPGATSIVLQGTSSAATGLVFGQGVRCVAGSLKRLYVKSASGGSITAPGAGDASVSLRSAALGSPIGAGEHRYYTVYYRDPLVLGGCPAISSFNTTDALDVQWAQ